LDWLDNPSENVYPLAIDATGQDPTYVGRIRKDMSVENGIDSVQLKPFKLFVNEEFTKALEVLKNLRPTLLMFLSFMRL